MKPLVVAFLTVVFGMASGPTQSVPSKPQIIQPDRPLRVNSTLVNTAFTVADKGGKGKLITNLNQTDFKIYEDDKLQNITNFSAEPNLPLSICLLIDTSGSVRNRLDFEHQAAIEFFYSTIHKGRDRGMVISFASAARVEQEFTDEPDTLANSIRGIRAGGGTSLYDAVYFAVHERLSKEPEDRRKVIIIISDGDDNSSRVSLLAAMEIAQRFNIAIYCISTNHRGFFGSREQDRGNQTLKNFSLQTGGRASFPLKIADIGNDFKNIGAELRSQYTIGYRPERIDDGTFRRIRIEVANKSYKARSRTGYYAPKPASQ